MTACDTKSIVDWLLDGARSAPRPELVLAELCERTVAAGIPLWRGAVFVRTLHPNIIGRRFIWQSGGGVTVTEGAFDLLANDNFKNSPFVAVVNTGQAIRRRLEGPDQPDEFPVFRELRAEGATDYLATPLIFTSGGVHVATWTTQQPGGFTDAHIAGIETIVQPLTRVAEIRALQRTAGNLLDTYVGHHAGERILAGRIRRGHTEMIHSVIWLSDMRGFTVAGGSAAAADPGRSAQPLFRLSGAGNSQTRRRGAQVHGRRAARDLPPARRRGQRGRSLRSRAGGGARSTIANIDAIDAPADLGPAHGVRFGLALHLGEVLYGNIGSGNRLDFTCIGPAVNLAARLEKLAARLGRTIILSAEFAQHSRSELEPLGEFAVAGFTAAQKAFGLSAGSPVKTADL